MCARGPSAVLEVLPMMRPFRPENSQLPNEQLPSAIPHHERPGSKPATPQLALCPQSGGLSPSSTWELSHCGRPLRVSPWRVLLERISGVLRYLDECLKWFSREEYSSVKHMAYRH